MKENVSVFYMHKRARSRLRGAGVAFTVFIVSLLSFFAFLGEAAVFESVFSALVRHTPLSYAVGYFLAASCTVVFCIFGISPLWRGIYAFVLGYLMHSRVDFGAVFSYYTAKRRYLYAVRATISSFLRLFFFLGAILCVLRVGRMLSLDLLLIREDARAMMVLALTFLFVAALLSSLWVLSARAYLMDAAFLSAPLLSYKQIKAISRCATKGRLGLIAAHRALLFPYFLLSVLCLGVPFLFVIPYALTAKGVLSLTLLRK